MFDRVGSLAERVATDVSRRAVLGRLGRGALGFAAVIGGVLALPSQARAGDQWCVTYMPRKPPGTPIPGPPCLTHYKAINGTCPCGGSLQDGKPNCPLTSCNGK
jgi:hypothetical protein